MCSANSNAEGETGSPTPTGTAGAGTQPRAVFNVWIGWSLLIGLLLVLGASRAEWHRERDAEPISPPRFMVDLNRATAAELRALPNIGSSLSARIIEYRETNGPFASPDELLHVHGMGPKTLETLAPMLDVGRH